MGGLVLDYFVVFFVKWVIRRIKIRGSDGWPAHSARVENTCCDSAYGECKVTYSYEIQGGKVTGSDTKPFVWSNSAKEYGKLFQKGRNVTIRTKPDNPEFSVMLDKDQSSITGK
jgi:hypothetical protein